MAKQRSTKSENDNYEDMKQKKGHRQTQDPNVKNSSEADMEDIRDAEEDGDIGDPFDQMMAKASRNARYTVAFIGNQGTVDANDPSNATPDEIENAPKTRKKK